MATTSSLSAETLRMLASGPSSMSAPTSAVGALSLNHSASSSSHQGSPEARSIEHHDSIPEEDEEDETSSEAVEPLTPTSDGHVFDVHHHHEVGGMLDGTAPDVTPTADHHHQHHQQQQQETTPKPFIIETRPTPPPRSSTTPRDVPSTVVPVALPTSESTVPNPPVRRSTVKRLTSMFHRTPSQAAMTTMQDPTSAPSMAAAPRPPTRRLTSFSLTPRASPRASMANTPPSPSSPAKTTSVESDRIDFMDPSGPSTAGLPDRIKTRSSTGLALNNRIRFNTPKPPTSHPPPRQRSTSMTAVPFVEPDNSFSLHAAAGVGLKARRLSTSLPDDFTVDTVDLLDEFTSSSVLPGRRGKLVGSGATASVKLMARKGRPSDELYAVKEFRKRGKHEDEGEYEKKVKSEYTIAKSLHHPNIVETVRLCKHHGRWNHVMEYCPQGELFSLVQKRYLEESDRLCLFKQLLRGVAYLHGHGIAHRDLKLENLLMTNEGYLKITDFGVSEVFCGEHPGVRASGGECGRNMGECRRSAPGICGSLPYIAPEVLEKKGDYDPRPLDVWSCALAYITMRFRGSPWPSADRSYPQHEKFLKGWEAFYEKHPDRLITDDSGLPRCGELFINIEPVALRRLILRMMHPMPEKRIGIHDALNDRWVKTIECCSPEEYEDGGGNVNGGGAGGGGGGGNVTRVATFDVCDKRSCKKAGMKGGIRKLHNHLPPVKRTLIHSFEIKEG
ncbi:MAG: hypothetical protein M1823_005033 [Watsoniomyces obsoletus]|nr:MAG: hypothetical protein M1823_005033 [Watsoniomyces obsoletus]